MPKRHKKRKMSLLQSRINAFKKIEALFYHTQNACPKEDLTLQNFSLKKRIGTESVDGTVWLGCTIKTKGKTTAKQTESCSRNSKPIALKIVPTDFITNDADIVKTKFWDEIAILRKVSSIAIKKESPHFPLFYGNYYCSHCDLMKYESCHILVSEFAIYGDLTYWLHNHATTVSQVKNAFFQIIKGIIDLQYFAKIRHDDLHWGNILVLKESAVGYTKYVIGKREYYLPNKGFRMIVWDYGRSRPLDKKLIGRDTVDLERILSAGQWLSEDYQDNVPMKFNEKQVQEILAILSYLRQKLVTKQITRIVDLLQDKIFEEYRKPQMAITDTFKM